MLDDLKNSAQAYGNRLFKNAKIAQAKQLLLAAVAEENQKITGIKAADSNLTQNYEELLNELSACRGGKVRYPYIGSGIGKGALVELCDGSVKYDFITGIGVHFFWT